ncbi:MAG: hypothetical protein OEQ53_05665 [Saprospiraceae bacterium]|nr:hypothetical protein [Saprospiraceae bacterium]
MILRPIHIIGYLAAFLFAPACASYQIPPKEIYIVTRDACTDELLSDVEICISRPHGGLITGATTNPLGYAVFKKPANQWDLDRDTLVLTRRIDDAEDVVEKVPLNKYLKWYEIYLDHPTPQPAGPQDTFRVADMHYHVTMKAQNTFGQTLYGPNDSAKHYPQNLTWHKMHDNLSVMYDGKWRRMKMRTINFDKVARGGKHLRRKEKMETLLEGKYVRPIKATNNMRDFTQATHPHIREGKVYLAFNAISPFEHNLSDTKAKRLISSGFKSGAHPNWLKKLGGKGGRFTHWRNFLSEYNLMRAQYNRNNHFPWRFLTSGSELKHDTIPSIVTVVEGSHIFQDTLFPHSLEYWMQTGKGERKKRDLEARITGQQKTMRQFRVEQKMMQQAYPYAEEKSSRDIVPQTVETALIEELITNIRTLKALRKPPVHMVTIGHLSYNGMMGHAPAIDDGKFPAKFLTKKVYSIRVSDDARYRKQWNGLFFSIPGPNQYGKAVMKELASNTSGQRRIHLDLKHSDYMTRKFFFDSVMVDYQLPPICSHCAVTGLSENYYSPFNDEYALRDASFTNTFYPFSINLFDEEIVKIYANKGIIGLPLEERVLGGYVNKRLKRPHEKAEDHSSPQQGKLLDKLGKGQRRWKYTRNVLEYLRVHNFAVLKPAFDFTASEMKVPVGEGADTLANIFEITCKDYVSAEPFIQNLFYIIDILIKHNPGSVQQVWKSVCIGSDLDGVIDPIDVCATATLYPHFRMRLKQFIPIFLAIRKLTNRDARDLGDYFSSLSLNQALDQLFYENLRDFAKHNFK